MEFHFYYEIQNVYGLRSSTLSAAGVVVGIEGVRMVLFIHFSGKNLHFMVSAATFNGRGSSVARSWGLDRGIYSLPMSRGN